MSNRRTAFTLIELLVAMMILAIATTISYLTFAQVSKAWERGMAMTKDMDHGDFVMEQIVMGLRSAYMPDAASTNPGSYGFWLEDDGEGESARDTISWVKLGSALVGQDSPLASAPHRIMITVENGESSEPEIALKAWRTYAQPEDFDPEKLDFVPLSKQVIGLNCRVATNMASGSVDWEDTWEQTNTLPPAVEVTLYLKPLEEGEPAVEMKRYVRIPRSPMELQTK